MREKLTAINNHVLGLFLQEPTVKAMPIWNLRSGGSGAYSLCDTAQIDDGAGQF